MKPTRQEPDGFATFWAIWRPYARHTDGRGDARNTFAKHIKNGADPQDIIDGARCFFRTMKDRDREYVPLASTWLNREAYTDLAEQERAHQERMAEVQARRAANVVNIAVVPASTQVSAERRRELVEMARRISRGQQ